MPERKSAVFLFAGICVAAVGSLLYFAHSAAIESAPAYSTLNTGPDGAKLLFDGLSEAGFVHVSRQFKSVGLEKPRQATVFFLGVERSSLQFEGKSYFEELETSARRGNNLILAVPKQAPYAMLGDRAKNKPDIAIYLGVNFISGKGVFSSVPTFDKTWRTVTAVGDQIWRRDFGSGSVTLVLDGDRLTNKGVATQESNRVLFRQLASEHSTDIFEEAHLGIQETGSIVGLARHYHLEGLLAGFLLLAALFVWNRSVRFPPAPRYQEKSLVGADTRSMLTELMTRHLKGQLIAACVAEWNRTRAHSPAIELPRETGTVSAYAYLQESLQKKTKFKS